MNLLLSQEQINGAATSVSTDEPEGGLEALAQVITCEEVIGWRNRSAAGLERGLNRIIIFITDAGFHFAGEGRVSYMPNPQHTC